MHFIFNKNIQFDPLGMSGYIRKVLHTKDVPKVIRVLNHTEKWLYKDFIYDLKGDIII